MISLVRGQTRDSEPSPATAAVITQTPWGESGKPVEGGISTFPLRKLIYQIRARALPAAEALR